MQHQIIRQTNLPAHAIQFSRFLRDNAFDIGPGEESDLLQSFAQSVPRSFDSQKALYKSLFVKNFIISIGKNFRELKIVRPKS